jgi:hypothetical protein
MACFRLTEIKSMKALFVWKWLFPSKSNLSQQGQCCDRDGQHVQCHVPCCELTVRPFNSVDACKRQRSLTKSKVA